MTTQKYIAEMIDNYETIAATLNVLKYLIPDSCIGKMGELEKESLFLKHTINQYRLAYIDNAPGCLLQEIDKVYCNKNLNVLLGIKKLLEEIHTH